MIAAMGLTPERDVYVCNILKCRPPGNRRPEPDESATCIPYLHEQLAARSAAGDRRARQHGRRCLARNEARHHEDSWSLELYRGRTLVMPTYHPSYLLRPSGQQAEAKRQAWEDLQLVMKELGIVAPKK